jgi:multiple RNA-binding domain-containing protein 1
VAKAGKEGSAGGGESGNSGAAVAGRTLYVKNLAFATSEAALRKAMAKAAPVAAVSIMTKANPKAGKGDAAQPARLSMGYGFVEYKTAAGAAAALKTLNGAKVDGHALQLKMSSRVGADESAPAAPPPRPGAAGGAAGDKPTKLVVRNVPFETNQKELRALLGAFGELASLRIPKKFDGSHRGFAFADFVTHEEATQAKASLESTHLYGRHLVIEWAEEEHSLEEVRRKTARYFSKLASDSGDGAAKRRKIEETLAGTSDAAFEDAFQ